ncbi:MAG: phosphatase PAP2 family protein [Gemmataceae bacterium]|nr:phosphatase PAP2 family protein [Gemmataceae bacterium]
MNDEPSSPGTAVPGLRAPWWLRGIFVALGLAGWFGTQAMLGARESPVGVIGDGLLDLLAGANRYLHDNPRAADALLIVSSTIINVLAVFLLAQSIFGKTVRPFLGLLMLFAMRQICQSLCALPAPEGIIWRDPGFPGFLVTYEVVSDFFFSGHTALAVLGSVELVRFGGRWWLPVGVLIAVFEATTVLVLRAHYTMDVYTGAIVALFAAILAERWAPWCDALLARVPGRWR